MHARPAALSAPNSAAGHCRSMLRWRLLDTHGQVWVSLLWGHCFFPLGPGVHNVLFVPSKSLFPQNNTETLVSPETRVFSLNNHRQENVGSHQKRIPRVQGQRRPQQDGRRGKIMFRIKPHTYQRCLKCSNETLCTPGPRDPTGTEPDLPSNV